MRATIILFLCGGCCSALCGQDFRVTERPSFVVTERAIENTPAALPAAKESQQPSTDLAVSEPAGVRQWYLVSEPWCGNCPAAKKRFRSLGWPEKNILTIAECEKRFGFRVPHVPFEFGEPLKTSVKPTPAPAESHPRQMTHREMVELHNQLHGGGNHKWPGDLATHLLEKHNVALPVDGIYDGRPGSHKDRESLIEHMLTFGIHPSEKHTLAELEALSDEELNALHTADHEKHGQVKEVGTKQQPVQMIERGGLCGGMFQKRSRRR